MSTPPQPGLPAEPRHPTTWARAIGMIVLTAALFVAVNVVLLAVLGVQPLNRTSWIVAEKWKLAGSSVPAQDVFVGDSSCNQAISPRVWEASSGRTAVNLCTIGDFALVDDVWLLEEYLRHNPAPERVFVQHVYDVWHRELRQELVAEVPRDWGFWNEGALPIALDFDGARKAALMRWLPVFGKRQSTQLAMSKLVRKRSISALRETSFQLSERGFMPWPKAAPERVERDAKRHLEFVTAEMPSMSQDNKRALAALSALAADHGFQVHIVRSPIFESLAAEPSFQAYRSGIVALLEAEVQREGVAIHREQHTFPANAMENADHLVTDAAETFTRWLAGEASRW